MKTEMLNQLADQMLPQVIAWRRYLHQYPELSFAEVNTSQFVFEILSSCPNLIVTRPTKTSVMARLIGGLPGKTMAIRADMDALPLIEENEFTFTSQNKGVMHACGHDGHTAILLGTATILSKLKAEICGEIRFLFQHAEENAPGGAQEMIKAKVMDNVDIVIGIHLWASMPYGKVGIISGAMMASPDTFSIKIMGRGGHAGYPHLSIDCIAIGAQIITNLQYIVSRHNDPTDNLVLSVTKFNSGTTHNIIPDTAQIEGTVRSFDNNLRKKNAILIEQIINGITTAHGAKYEFQYEYGYDPVINTPEVASFLENIVKTSLGETWVEKMRPSMAGEDFSAFIHHAPGCYLFVGAGNVDKGIIFPHHHPRFNIEENALLAAMKIFLNACNELENIGSIYHNCTR